MSPVSFVIALAVVIAALSVSPVKGYYFYYHYYYYTDQPKLCAHPYYAPNTIKGCPISSCHCSLTYADCCLRYFISGNMMYKECICSLHTTCAPTNSTIDNPPPQTTQSLTTATTPTTLTPNTTTPTTLTPNTTTPSPANRSLCANGFRLLNGESVTPCDFKGVANITVRNGTLTNCHAVYAPATVNGTFKDTFITSTFCKTVIESAKDKLSEMQIGKQTYPLSAPLFTFVEAPNGVAFIVINPRFVNLLSDLGCQKGACPYNKTTMVGKVDFNNCKIVSYGSVDPITQLSDGFKEAKIALNPGGCTNIKDGYGAVNTLCFQTINGAPLICSRDTSSPIYCQAPSNGEWILVALSTFQAGCSESPEVKGIPYPG